MELFRLHAYAITPQRTAATTSTPVGGAVTINAVLRQTIQSSIVTARFHSRSLIDFDVDASTRTNEARDHVVAFAFGDAARARGAALGLADRLARAMDMRSAACLLVLAAMRNEDQRGVTIWIFPREQAFRLRSAGAGASIQVLTDVFSQTSNLRKAAAFEGRNLRNEFIQGRVLDFQANRIAQDVADFWIKRFLQCVLSIAGDAGTRMLAKTIRRAMEVSDELDVQEQLSAAVIAVRASPKPRWSLQEFADTYLSDVARERFLASVPNQESRNSMFDFRRDVFDEALKFRVFALDSGVWVSSPITEVGRSVRVVDQMLSCEGRVVSERMRARHG